LRVLQFGESLEMALPEQKVQTEVIMETPLPPIADQEIPEQGNSEQGIPLLELAEVLDQHKIWVETGGESGAKAELSGANLQGADLTGVNLQGACLERANLRGADLSMANLRGVSLMHSDLGGANLLGTELRGANLMGAILYGTEGLWVGRLGGTNLFDALLPESVAQFDGAKAIAEATKVARLVFYSMMSLCVLCGLLIIFTSDVRLLLDASAIPGANMPNVLPMTGFYLGAPLLLCALYLRFHFLLLHLWGSIASLPAVFPDGETPDKDGPWFLMGLIRRSFRGPKDVRSPLATLESVLATILVYWIVPITLLLFWLRYLVRQDFRGTMLHIVLVTAAVGAATSLPILVSRVLRPGDLLHAGSRKILRLAAKTLWAAMITGLALLLLSAGVLRGLPADSSVAPQYGATNVRRWAAQLMQNVGFRPFADVTEASFTPALRRGGLSEAELAEVPGARLNQSNLRYARGYRVVLLNARLWRGNLEGAYLSEADLRGANLREAVLRSATLDRVQAARANMVSVDAKNVNFAGADLRGTDLSYGDFENAILSNSKLNTASLYAANLHNANLLRADLSRADLRDVKLENASLALAILQETDLSAAKLAGANLSGAQLKGTMLLDADLRQADLRGAALAGAILRGAQLGGANLDGADLRGAIGISAEQLCSTNHWASSQMDPDLSAEVQNRCGTPQVAAAVAAPAVPAKRGKP
jgi:uncharacterized protein YjbI with pentapeptide repeats